ncbi:MAG TPA: hypothetical protein VGH40_11785 [Roseiarcus sp.]|jgi:acetyl-CoA carboxylase alpha subunit
MRDLPVYVEATPRDLPDAYLRKDGATTALRLADDASAGRLGLPIRRVLDPRNPPVGVAAEIDATSSAVARVAAVLPEAVNPSLAEIEGRDA